MTDFPPARPETEGRLTHRIWREVIVQHERFAVFAFKSIHDLLVLTGTERRRNQRLGLSAREKRRSMGTRKNTHLA